MKTRVSNYYPKPEDTSDVTISDSLLQLSEDLAKNTHEIWAAARMKEGWTYGAKRDDVLKTHPDLVPYNELPESEKEYDRATSLNTIKLILKLGFTIEKK